jgi:hypothetical protein
VNWLGLSVRALAGALLGALLGAAIYAVTLVRGWDVPFAVGALAGLGACSGSQDKSAMRGMFIAASAIWIAAVVQSWVGPYAQAGLFGLHTTLTWKRLIAFALCGGLAFVLAQRSLRRDAPKRHAGS